MEGGESVADQLTKEVAAWRVAYRRRVADLGQADAGIQLVEVNARRRIVSLTIGVDERSLVVRFTDKFEPMRTGQLRVECGPGGASAAGAGDEGLQELCDHVNGLLAKEGSYHGQHKFLRTALSSLLTELADAYTDGEAGAAMPAPMAAVARSETGRQVRDLWSHARLDASAHAAKRRVLSELEELPGLDPTARVRLVDDNPFHWHVEMAGFPPGGAEGEGMGAGGAAAAATGGLPGTLGGDLAACGREHLDLEVRFPPSYPADPPIVRLVRPILVPFTGRASSGAFALPVLMTRGWDESRDVALILRELRGSLLKYGARVDVARGGAESEYPLDSFLASHIYIHDRDPTTSVGAGGGGGGGGSGGSGREGGGGKGGRGTRGTRNVNEFQQSYTVVSRTFGREVMGLGPRLGPRFEAGNKVLMPQSALTGMEAAGKRALDDEWVSGAATCFELATKAGIRAYCGCLEFTSPEEDLVIVPDWLLADMFGTEGMTVTARSVELPKVSQVTLQPHSDDWTRVQETAGMDGKLFLQEALKHHTTLAKGSTVRLSARPPHIAAAAGDDDDDSAFTSFAFTVVDIVPDMPACRIWTEFFEDLPVSITDAVVFKDEKVRDEAAARRLYKEHQKRQQQRQGRQHGGVAAAAAAAAAVSTDPNALRKREQALTALREERGNGSGGDGSESKGGGGHGAAADRAAAGASAIAGVDVDMVPWLKELAHSGTLRPDDMPLLDQDFIMQNLGAILV